MPPWLEALAWLPMIAGGLSAAIIVIDLRGGRPQRMAIRNAVWPIARLYFGPAGL